MKAQVKETLEVYYFDGTVSMNLLEGDEHMSIEFFTNNQSKESFENAEYDNIFLIENFMAQSFTGYELKHPSNISDEILNDILKECRELIQSEWLS